MTTHPARQDLVEALKPCPFCGHALQCRKGVNSYGRCVTEDCYGAKMPVVSLDDPPSVVAWNTRAALASEAASHEPADGWVLVPKEPTPAMIDAGLIEGSDDPDHEASSIGHQWVRQAIYRAMIAAAPDQEGPADGK